MRKLFCLPLAFWGIAISSLAQTSPPNIVIILADDLGYGDVSKNGRVEYQTPNIDSFATNGVWFTNGYVTHPFCSPSRAALLTGRYQQRFGHEDQPEGDNSNPRLGLPMSEILLPQLLKPAGYVCGVVGKWHLGEAPNFNPVNRGFDSFFGFLGASSSYYNATLRQNYTKFTESSYLTDAFTSEAVNFINNHATQPFFLYLAYNAVHAPYDTPPASYMNRVSNITNSSLQIYAAMTIALDDGVGQVLATLQTNNLLNNTLIFFLSDNGAPYTPAGFTRNLPLRGYKLNTLEGGIRIPFAVQWPGHLPAGLIYNEPVSSLDIVATVAAVAGVSLPNDRAYDGLNIIPYLTGQTAPQRTLFWRHSGLGKTGPPGSEGTIWAVRSGDLKLVTEKATVGNPPALYNLANDIGETQNLALAQPAQVNSLQDLYDQWTLETISPLWRHTVGWTEKPLVLAGDWNGFNISDSRSPWKLTNTMAPAVPPSGTPDAFSWFTNTIHVSSSAGDTAPGLHSFAVVGGRTYSKQWGGVTINVDSTNSVPFSSGSNLGPTNNISLQDGFYYSFRILEWKDQVGASMNVAVMKTSAPPITVSRSGQTPDAPAPGVSVVVSITTSQAKSPEERIFLRWSTDLFVTSNLVKATGSGTSYVATIPPQPADTMVQYTALTSTVDLSALHASGAIDPLILATSETFKFVTSGGGSTPTPTPTPTATPTPTPTPTATPGSTDLSITVTDGKSATIAGQNDTYTIVVSNAGPSHVTGAGVTDNFPASFTGVTFSATQSGGATGFTASGSGSISDTVTMPVGSSITYKATGKVSSSATGTISNTAKVTSPSGVTDSNPANNSATDTDTINLQANLKITVTDGKTSTAPGRRDIYTIVVTNLGPSNVKGAAVKDSFPNTFTGITYSATQSGGASGFTASGSGNINNTITMPSGSTITYKANGKISSSASGSISDTATVSVPAGVTDPNTANNTATDTDSL